LVQSIIKTGNTSSLHLGYQIYDQDYPAPLPTTNEDRFFGPLFAITFYDHETKQQHVRAIAMAEYISALGYELSFNTVICQMLQHPHLLRPTIPARTMTAIAHQMHTIVTSPITDLLTLQSEQFGVDLSVSALFNRVIATKFPDNETWSRAYLSDDNCRTIMEMLKNPSSITTARLQLVDPI
jgi:hypothetical protein